MRAPFVPLPALAMDKRPVVVWRSLKFSSSNLHVLYGSIQYSQYTLVSKSNRQAVASSLGSINGLAACSISIREVASLDHCGYNHSVSLYWHVARRGLCA